MRPSLLAATALVASVLSATAQPPLTVGDVTRSVGPVSAEQFDWKRDIKTGSTLHNDDMLRSGAAARMHATLLDGSELTLGENAELVVDDFVYDPEAAEGVLAVDVKGAFLFVGGAIEDRTGADVRLNTPVGTLGVRGTTVWGGETTAAMASWCSTARSA